VKSLNAAKRLEQFMLNQLPMLAGGIKAKGKGSYEVHILLRRGIPRALVDDLMRRAQQVFSARVKAS
ncbi:MAG TPA: hypothetical protein VI685_11280, partial [Candidatus Angelobacter sp.]